MPKILVISVSWSWYSKNILPAEKVASIFVYKYVSIPFIPIGLFFRKDHKNHKNGTCDMPHDSGSGPRLLKRFYFHSNERKCKTFYYKGLKILNIFLSFHFNF